MSVLDRVRAQGARSETLTVEVAEWGDDGQPLVIHYHPPTLNNAAEALDAAPNNQIRQNVDMFCQLARNADGSPIFKRLEALDLMESADPQVLRRLMLEMGIISNGTGADLEKN